MDEFGPLNLLPRPGRQWAPVVVKGGDSETPRRRRRRATYNRNDGVRHLLAAYDLGADKIYGHIKDHEEPDEVPRVLPVSAQSVSGRGADRDRDGQLQSALVDEEGLPCRRRG